jgi:hypothetical protein
MILVMTDHPCLKVGRHKWYQSLTGIIHRVRSYFWKNYSEDTLTCSYKDYNSLNRWQANRVLLSALLSANYFSVTMRLRQGKKVSILPLGDVNLGSIPSRWGLLEDSPYRVIGVVCHRWTDHDRTPRAWKPRNVLCSLPQYVNTFL